MSFKGVRKPSIFFKTKTMGNYLSEIFAFVVGGGLTTLINIRTNKKIATLEYMERLKKFLEGENISLMDRIINIEEKLKAQEESFGNQIKVLTALKCERHPCSRRVPPTDMDIKTQQ